MLRCKIVLKFVACVRWFEHLIVPYHVRRRMHVYRAFLKRSRLLLATVLNLNLSNAATNQTKCFDVHISHEAIATAFAYAYPPLLPTTKAKKQEGLPPCHRGRPSSLVCPPLYPGGGRVFWR